MRAIQAKRVEYELSREIGDDLAIRHDTQAMDEAINHSLKKNQSSTVTFRYRMPNSTHAYFKNLTKH